MNKIVFLSIALLANTQHLMSDALIYRQFEEYIIIDQDEEELPAPVSYPTAAPKSCIPGKEIS